MRIAILNSLFPPYRVGGAEQSVALLAHGLARRGDQVSVISLHPGRARLTESIEGITLHRLPLRNLYWPWGRTAKPPLLRRLAWHLGDAWNPAAAADVRAVLDLEKPDLLHLNTLAGFSPSIHREARRRGIPIIQTLRDYGLLCSRATLFRNGRRCERRCIECRVLTSTRLRAAGHCDRVIANSQFLLVEHRRQGALPDLPADVIFNIAAEPERASRPSWDEEPDLVFGYIGRIEPEKGIETILEAARRLRSRGWRLKIAGDGLPDYVRPLREAHRDLPIDWLGFVPAADFLAAVDTVLVASHWHEPLPRSLIESLAAGKSAICSTAGGIPEVSALGAVTASFAPGDAAGLARLMQRALLEPERWRFGAGSAPLPAAFSEQTVVSLYRDAYRRVLAGRGRP